VAACRRRGGGGSVKRGGGAQCNDGSAVAAAQRLRRWWQRDVGGSLAAARRWLQRDSATSAAAWRRHGVGGSGSGGSVTVQRLGGGCGGRDGGRRWTGRGRGQLRSMAQDKRVAQRESGERQCNNQLGKRYAIVSIGEIQWCHSLSLG